MTDPGNFRELRAGSFIYALDHALSDNVCEQMIARFESNKDQQYAGRIGNDERLEQSIKQSTDLRISGRQDWKDIDRVLQESLGLGLSLIAGLHPFFQVSRFNDIGYNMQRSQPGEFYHWHVDSGPGDFTRRQLVAIWYLNPLDDSVGQSGGETEFYHQQVSVKPSRGMLLLFPPFWTHLHRGTEVGIGVKYIATTWVCIE